MRTQSALSVTKAWSRCVHARTRHARTRCAVVRRPVSTPATCDRCSLPPVPRTLALAASTRALIPPAPFLSRLLLLTICHLHNPTWLTVEEEKNDDGPENDAQLALHRVQWQRRDNEAGFWHSFDASISDVIEERRREGHSTARFRFAHPVDGRMLDMVLDFASLSLSEWDDDYVPPRSPRRRSSTDDGVRPGSPLRPMFPLDVSRGVSPDAATAAGEGVSALRGGSGTDAAPGSLPGVPTTVKGLVPMPEKAPLPPAGGGGGWSPGGALAPGGRRSNIKRPSMNRPAECVLALAPGAERVRRYVRHAPSDFITLKVKSCICLGDARSCGLQPLLAARTSCYALPAQCCPALMC